MTSERFVADRMRWTARRKAAVVVALDAGQPVDTTGIAFASSLPLVIRAVDFAGNETDFSLVVRIK